MLRTAREEGRRWRAAYLRRTFETGAYRPYELLVAEAAAETGLSPSLAAQLAARYGELKPWPEVLEVLRALHGDGIALGIVTNCSEELGATAVACVTVQLASVSAAA
jgi:2-haloacid dehalogenase